MGKGPALLQSEVLCTKLLIPGSSEVNIRRTRLLDRLAIGQHRKLTLVSAPAGFGKTTLLSDWTRQAENLYACFTLDEADNNLARFLSYLTAAITELDSRIMEAYRASVISPERFSLETSLTALINVVTAFARPLVLVMDDYHLIRSDDAHQAVIFILNHLPQNMHLVISTRADPPLPTALLRSRMQLNEFRADDLRFNESEAAAFLNKIADIQLTKANIASLSVRTEGWAAGLQMVALSMKGKSDVSDYIDSLNGTQAFISEYLTTEVLDRQPQQVRNFLLRTSILDYLTGSLCNNLLESQNADQMLRELHENNLFLTIVDPQTPWYRYHPLFADVLQHRLKQEFHDSKIELHRRASRWFELNNHTNQAIEHALRADDFERACFLMDQAARSVFMRGETDTLLTWVNELPEAIIGNNVTLCIFRALAQILSGFPEPEVMAQLMGIKKLQHQQSEPGEIWVVRALLASQHGNHARSIACCKRAVQLLRGGNDYLLGYAIGNLGDAYIHYGDLHSAGAALQEALAISQKTMDRPNIVLITKLIGTACFHEGKFHEAKVYYDRALRLGSQLNGSSPPIMGRVMTCLGRLFLESYELNRADEMFVSAMQLSSHIGISAMVAAQLGRVMVKLLQEEFEKAGEILDAARLLLDQMNPPYSDILPIDLLQLQFWILSGELEQAKAWVNAALQRILEIQAQAINLLEGQAILARAKVQIVDARVTDTALPETVLTDLEHLVKTAQAQGWGLLLRETLVHLAIAYERAGDTLQGLKRLKMALKLSAGENHLRIFIENGPAIRGLLYKALESGYTRRFTSQVLLSIENRISDANQDVFEKEGALKPLTAREIEVLLLLQSGSTNKMISEELVISLSTTKAHLYNIYQKLNVHSRTHALSKAHELGILEPSK